MGEELGGETSYTAAPSGGQRVERQKFCGCDLPLSHAENSTARRVDGDDDATDCIGVGLSVAVTGDCGIGSGEAEEEVVVVMVELSSFCRLLHFC